MMSAEQRASALHITSVGSSEQPSPAPVDAVVSKVRAESEIADPTVGIDEVDFKLRVPDDSARGTRFESSVEKPKRRPASQTAMALLPDEILRSIFYELDPETFSSAVLVCRTWRAASNDSKLYSHHLSGSHAFSSYNSPPAGPFSEDSLHELKRRFAQETKRCLYLPFLRPKITTINLVSEAPLSSFAAGPGGEKFEFTFSHFARWCLAVSSSRIYVVNLCKGKDVEVTKELKVLRRPLAADILPDGTVMAVLSSDHSVSLYSVNEDKVELKKSVELDNPPYNIAMSPGGEILAAAFEGGLELCSLRENASASEKRSVKTHRMDKMMFSSDGSMLLGTTQGRDPATVVLTAPYFSAVEFDLTPSELVNSMWTQQILFPSSSRDCSHSTLLPRSGDQDSNWTLTYDRTYESFRAVRTDDLRNGTTYFTGPQTGNDRRVVWSKDALVPATLPSATARGDLVAAGFNGSEVWLYSVPEHLDAPSNSTVSTDPVAAQDAVASEMAVSQDVWRDDASENEGPPRWQMLVDKHRNVFSRGKKVADVNNVSSMCWSMANDRKRGDISERLVIAAPGGVGSDTSLEEATPIDGGRLIILDFVLQPHTGEKSERTIELGTMEPQLLEEHKPDLETEIARARRRTMFQRDAARVRSVLDALRPDNALEDVPEVPGLPATMNGNASTPAAEPEVSDDDESGITLEEAAAFAEGPYSHANPRSRTALYRSATVNQASRRHVQQAPQPEVPPLPMRRQDGTEVPDESDADNWVPPPPPYQRHADELLPDDLVQRALLYNGIAPLPSTAESMVRPRRSSSLNERSSRRRSSAEVDILTQHLRRPMRQPSDISLGGDASTVSSVSVTPRSSIRRRPLTVYQSSSSALRDSIISRTGSQAGRTPSLASSSTRISRSESLRRVSQYGNEAVPVAVASSAILPSITSSPSPVSSEAHSPVQSLPLEQPDWPLPAPPTLSEEHEDVSPPIEPSPESALDPEEASVKPSPDFEPDDPSETSPGVEPLPEPIVQVAPAAYGASDEDVRSRHHERHSLPAPEVVPEPQAGLEPVMQEYSSFAQPISLSDYQISGSNLSRSTPATALSSPPMSPGQRDDGDLPELYTGNTASGTTDLPLVQNDLPFNIPEPSTSQLAALQNRPRPQMRQLSNGSARGQTIPSPPPPPPPPPPTAAIRTHRAPPDDPSEVGVPAKPRSDRNGRRLSQRIRGALRRNETEPLPELPQIPHMYKPAEPSPTGPARHSRMYASVRNNASEPSLRARPPAQRLDTIQSINTVQVQTPMGEVPALPPVGVPQASSERPQAKRSRSIFGRRKSRDASKVSQQQQQKEPDLPPVPTVPSLPPQAPAAYGRGSQSLASPVPSTMRRAATDRQAEYFNRNEIMTSEGRFDREPHQAAHDDARELRRRKGKDKDGKCVLM